MNLNDFELWAYSCGIGNTKLYTIKEDGEGTGVYQTKSKYEEKHNFYYTTPVYHVWVKGKPIVSTLNYREACGVYENRLKELGIIKT